MSRDDVEAALAVRREQGRSLEPALVDSMARQVEATVRRRFEAEVQERKRAEMAASAGRGAQLALAITSVVLAIPLTAIAGAYGGLIGMTIAWVGVVLVNVAMAMRKPPKK